MFLSRLPEVYNLSYLESFYATGGQTGDTRNFHGHSKYRLPSVVYLNSVTDILASNAGELPNCQARH
jgi:hypothetical protein